MKKIALASITFLLVGCSGNSLNQASNGASSSRSENAYDAVSIFETGTSSVASLPTPGSDEIVVNYGGWSLNQLFETAIGKQYFQFVHDSYKTESWASATLPPGVYTLKEGEPIPVVILATTLLAYRVQKGEMNFDNKSDPLVRMVDKTHCNERNTDSYVGLYWGEGKLFVDKDYCSVQGGGVWEAKI